MGARMQAARGVGGQAAALAVAFDGAAEDILDEAKAAKELNRVQNKKKEEAAAREAETRRIRAAQVAAFEANKDPSGLSTVEKKEKRVRSRSRSRDRDNTGFPSTRAAADVGMLSFSTSALKRRIVSDKNPAHEG